MKMNSHQLLCLFLGVFCCISISTVNALNCYQCNSHLHPECADFKAHLPHKTAGFHQPCDDFDSEGNPAFCRIISYKFKLMKKSDAESKRVVRTCGYRRSQKECYSADNDHHTETVCQCFEDGCNSAANLSILSVFSTLIIASLLSKFI